MLVGRPIAAGRLRSERVGPGASERHDLVDCGPSNGRRPLLPEDMVSNHVEPDEEA
jgi:hypothetical protein